MKNMKENKSSNIFSSVRIKFKKKNTGERKCFAKKLEEEMEKETKIIQLCSPGFSGHFLVRSRRDI